MIGAMVEEIWTSCGGDKSETGKLGKEEMRDFVQLITGRESITDQQLDESFKRAKKNERY